jgi:hypothetical protein
VTIIWLVPIMANKFKILKESKEQKYHSSIIRHHVMAYIPHNFPSRYGIERERKRERNLKERETLKKEKK